MYNLKCAFIMYPNTDRRHQANQSCGFGVGSNSVLLESKPESESKKDVLSLSAIQGKK